MLKDKALLFVIILSGLAFILYAWPSFVLRPSANGADIRIFNTPDETANNYFAGILANTGLPAKYEPINGDNALLIHPRSIKVYDNQLVPGSFIGFIVILAALSKFITLNGIVYVVPFFAALGLIFAFLLARRIFDERTALVAAILLMAAPAYWYYASRSLFNNVFFIDLCLIGGWCLVKFFADQRTWRLLAGAGLLALALTVRTSEAIWLLPLLFVTYLANRRQISWQKLGLAGVCGVVCFLPVFIYQQLIYGNFLSFGYTVHDPSFVPAVQSASRAWWQAVFPSDISLANIYFNLKYYLAKYFYWYLLPAAGGAVIIIDAWCQQWAKAEEKYYLAVAAAVSAIIAIYYGSWRFTDNLAGVATIGSSQARYFLPIYVLAVPLAAVAVVWLSRKMPAKLQTVSIALMLMVVLVLSAQTTVFAGSESLSAVISTVKGYYGINAAVRQKTPADAIIITKYDDKVFFPDRRVITDWNDTNHPAVIKKLAQAGKLYYYTVSGREANSSAEQFGLRFQPLLNLSQGGVLYAVKAVD